MINIRPVSDLRNKYPEIEELVLKEDEAVYLTKNGYGSMVVMSLEKYSKLMKDLNSEEMLESRFGVEDIEKELEKAEEENEYNSRYYTNEEMKQMARRIIDGQYEIKYFPTFINQFNEILYYIVHNLENKDAADKLYKEVVKQIEKRSKFPTAFEIFKNTKDKNINWYKLRVKNFTIFYMVRNNSMEIKRIYYSKRNFNKLI